MDHFAKVFIEEATDLIAGLEKALLALEARPADKGMVEQVFRVMHTLKGNSHMFGFEAMGVLTHHLETLYEQVREEKRTLSPALLTLTLTAVDHFKRLLDDPHLQNPGTRTAHPLLVGQVEAFIAEGVAERTDGSLPATKTGEGSLHTYYVRFAPGPDMLRNGTNPLYLLDELAGLGTCRALPRTHLIPELATLEPGQCYTFWEILLATDAGESGIRDVFIFVEGQCQLQIRVLAAGNLFNNPTFVARVNLDGESGKELELPLLQQLAADVAPARQFSAPESAAKPTLPLKETGTASIRVASDKLDQLLNLVSEMVTTQAQLSLLAEQHAIPGLLAIAENVEKLSRQLRDNTFSICLVPVETIVTRFHRLVRDLSGELGKEIVLLTEGTDTELDKTIIDSLADPLLHILRNSIDHGIESTEERIRKGKPAKGTIWLKAFYAGTQVHIQVQDDGAGIQAGKVREKAVQKGLIQADASLTEKEMLDLIFLPGFSTATRVTDISGRGVGMDVVRRKIGDLRGEVEIASKANVGTTLTLKLPLTLSILDGLLVRIADTHYVVPLTAVDKCYEVGRKALTGSFNNLIVLDGRQVPFFYLRSEFGVTGPAPERQQMVVVQYADRRVGLSVDAILGEYQAVLKPLGKLYRRQDLIAGATILGDGTIALVMDIDKMIRQCSDGIPATAVSQ